MKNIHLIPTDKPSRLVKNNLGIAINEDFTKSMLDLIQAKFINRYITSDEEIKEGEWYENNGVIFKADDVFNEGNNPNNSNPRVTDFNKKIILTDNEFLIKDGVQAIDDEFLEWFVNNPNCEEVGIENNYLIWKNSEKEKLSECYKIIIPKEEPKQETFEEAAERLYPTTRDSFTTNGHDESIMERLIFKEGAKWQQEQDKNKYSEEDMRKSYFAAIKSTGEGWNGEYADGNNPNIEKTFKEGFEIFIEQFKKK